MYNAPLIAGNHEQEKEYYTRKILKFFPDRENDPALLYGDSKLEYLRLVNEGMIPDEAFISDFPAPPEPPKLPPPHQTTNMLWDWPEKAGWELEQGEMRHPKGGDTYVFTEQIQHVGDFIPFDPRRDYSFSVDITSDTPGTVTYISLGFFDINRESISVGSGHYIVNTFTVPHTGWHNHTLDVRENLTIPDNAYYIQPNFYANHSRGEQGGIQWIANLRMVDVTDQRQPVFVDWQSNAAQAALVKDAWTPVIYGYKTVDTHGAFSNGTTFTAPRDGFYMVSASVLMASAPVGTLQRLVLFKNGAIWNSLDRIFKSDAGQAQLLGSTALRLNRGDTLEIYCSTSTSVGISSGRSNTSLQIAQIG